MCLQQRLYVCLLLNFRAFDVELLYIAEALHIPTDEVAVYWTEIEGRYADIQLFSFLSKAPLTQSEQLIIRNIQFHRIQSNASLELDTDGWGFSFNLAPLQNWCMEILNNWRINWEGSKNSTCCLPWLRTYNSQWIKVVFLYCVCIFHSF